MRNLKPFQCFMPLRWSCFYQESLGTLGWHSKEKSSIKKDAFVHFERKRLF